MKKIGLSLAAVLLLSACQTPQPAQQTTTANKTDTTAAQNDTTVKTNDVASNAGNPLTDPNNILSQRVVYFDFDKYNVKDDAVSLIQAHSGYLTKNNVRVSLQGHTDERGTAEYNLALGQKRANAVKKVMVSAYRVADQQIETTSYGKERPAAEGHDESAWSQNRRVEIVYPGEANYPKN